MKLTILLLSLPTLAIAQFYGDPPDAHHPWAVHDMNRPQPAIVSPAGVSTQAEPGAPPSDAIVLFGGTDLAKWTKDNKDSKKEWIVKDGAMECVPGSGYIKTIEEFGDCQLHVEWAAPTDVQGNSQGRGNSGVFLMGMVEVQVLDNYDNPTYADGTAACVYGINPPMANALRPPGQFQTYDIIFRRPIFKDGVELDPGYLTVFCNGVLMQDHTPLEGGGGHKGRSKPRAFPEKGPLKIQDHGNPVRFRNIWYRPLPPRNIEGGTVGKMSEEATKAKRAEIAADIRKDAATKQGNDQLMRNLESLCYEVDPATLAASEKAATALITTVAADKTDAQKGTILQLRTALEYLTNFKIIDQNFPPKAAVHKLIADKNWDPKK